METRKIRILGTDFIVIKKDEEISISNAGIPVSESVKRDIVESFGTVEDFWNVCEPV